MKDNKLKQKIFIQTFGWPLVPVPRDDFEDIKGTKRFDIKKLQKIY